MSDDDSVLPMRPAKRGRSLAARARRCSVCRRVRSAGMKLISGPNVLICSTCCHATTARLAPRSGRAPDLPQCHFCQQRRIPADVTKAGRLTICAYCLYTMEEILKDIGA